MSSSVLDGPLVTSDVDGSSASGGPRVFGVHCKNGHFNDPKLVYCSMCGISMLQSTRVPLLGVRPPLGVLVLDDGTMFPLVRDHVIGRAPEADETVAAGETTPVRLVDPLMSRVHARVVLDGWEVWVVDAGSTNGTFLWSVEESAWTRLPSGTGEALRPGAVIAFGQRQLHYHSYRTP